MIPFRAWPLSALEHFGFITAGLLVYVLVTRVRRQRRHPSAAIAWVVLIAVLPYVGVPLFLAIGTRKFARPTPIAAHGESAPSAVAAPSWATGLLAALGAAAPQPSRSVRFVDDGAQALDALIDLIDRARQHLAICSFVLGNDAVGARVADSLAAAARRGVRVRLLIDAIGSLGGRHALFAQMRSSGVEIRRFMPLLRNPMRGRTNLRNHRKLAVADDDLLWSGGRNLAAEYFAGSDRHDAWRDLSVVVEGGVARPARRQFDHDWTLAGGKPLNEQPGILASPQETSHVGLARGGLRHSRESAPPAPRWDEPPTQWIASGPDHADDTVHALLLAGAYHASGRILAVTPYFVPDDALLDAWCLASRRGVRVTLLLPQRSNHRVADWARERALRRLVDNGGRVLLAPRMIHAKAIVIDAAVALCGSLNLDARSLFLNFEAMLAFYGADEIAWLAAWIEREAESSRPYCANRPPWWRDVGEGMVAAIGFQL